jgi:hypothetical protein
LNLLHRRLLLEILEVFHRHYFLEEELLEVRFLNLQLCLVQCDHRLRQIHQNMLGLLQGFHHL